jgi:PadR family transcriptional regulator AphA
VSLRHALLGLLTAKPMTGYDLAKVFERSVDYVWHAPHSQIYPELRRMEADGLVAAEIVPRGTRGRKRAYAVTDAGRAELRRWVAEVTPIEQPRDVERLRSTYLELASYDDARRYFRAHLEHYELWQRRWNLHARQIEALETSLIRSRLAAPNTGDPEAAVAYKVHAYRGLAAQAGLEVSWARDGLALVDKLEALAAQRGTLQPSTRPVEPSFDLNLLPYDQRTSRESGRGRRAQEERRDAKDHACMLGLRPDLAPRRRAGRRRGG